MLRRLAAASHRLLARLLRPLHALLLRTLRLGPGAPSPVEDARISARAFVAAFAAVHPRGPPFVAVSYRDALAQAGREHRFLCVYLHSAVHVDTPRFCADALTAPPVVDLLAARCVAWGGDIAKAEGFAVANMLRVSAFPCVALILPASPRPVLVACVCGLTPATRLVRLLGAAMEAHGEPLAAARRDAAQRAHGRALRAEQDAALAASLAEDRQREEARAEAERARAAAEADARHLEAEAAAEAAVREAAAVAAAEAAEALRLARAAALRPEPAAGSVGCVAVLLRLPDGGRLQRRFDPQVDTAESLYGWAEATGVAPGFSLVTSFPRSVLPRGERTLADVGVTAQAALLVERL